MIFLKWHLGRLRVLGVAVLVAGCGGAGGGGPTSDDAHPFDAADAAGDTTDGAADGAEANADAGTDRTDAEADGAGDAPAGSDGGLFALSAVYGHGMSALGDVDGDGKIDLILVSNPTPTNQSISVWKGHGDGTFSTAGVTTPIPTTVGQFSSAGDLNGDGRWDIGLRASGSSPAKITQFLGQTDGSFSLGATLTAGDAVLTWQPCASGDFDGDGQSELLFIAFVPGGTLKYSFTSTAPAGPSAGSFNFLLGSRGGAACSGAAAGDVDGDGKLDVAMTLTTWLSAQPSPTVSIAILYGNGDRTFRSGTTSLPATTGDAAQPVDIDGDGKADLEISGLTSCNVMWNDGAAVFSATALPCPAYTGDFDADGNRDLLFNVVPSPYILFGDGARGFGRSLTIPRSTLESSPFAVEVDQDGATDLAFYGVLAPGGWPAVSYVYRSTAKGSAHGPPDVQCDATLGGLCAPAAAF